MINQNQSATKREVAMRQYATARGNLLLMLGLTLVNIILLVANADVMLLFSATVPYYSVAFGIVDETGLLLIPAIFVAAVSLIAYFLCWIFSKKHYGWMIAALVLFILDTVFLVVLYLWLQDFSGILDLLIHIWVLYYLIIGVKYGAKLRKMPEDAVADGEEVLLNADGSVTQTDYSTYKRAADLTVKARILLEAEVLGHRVCYRRVKRVNELVVDGNVYDEVEMLVETAHSLTVVVDGHTIVAGFDGGAKSYLLVDGQEIAKKTRLY